MFVELDDDHGDNRKYGGKSLKEMLLTSSGRPMPDPEVNYTEIERAFEMSGLQRSRCVKTGLFQSLGHDRWVPISICLRNV